MFLQASVILLTGGAALGGVSAPWGCLLCGVSALEGVSAPRRVWSGGVCSQGDAWWRHPPGTATAAGGTHPTGMHSSWSESFGLLRILNNLEQYC